MKNKRIKSLLSIVLCITLILSNIAFADTASTQLVQYADITGNKYEVQIKEWIANGFVKGYPDGNFKPGNQITRSEFMALVNRAYGFTEVMEVKYSDVTKTQWYYNDAAIATKAGFIQGADGKLMPLDNITRQEMAVILSRLTKNEKAVTDDAVINNITDKNEISAWSKAAISVAMKNKFFDGFVDKVFMPTEKITRLEAVVALDRAFKSMYKGAYTKQGVYGPETGTQTLEGDVVIIASEVTLKNTIINGNLILRETIGEGNVYLDNVVVKGETIVKGGGANSIVIKNSTLGKIVVIKEGNTVRIVATGTTTIGTVDIGANAKLEEFELTGTGFNDVIVLNDIPVGANVVFEGSFGDVQIDSANINVAVEDGTIGTLTLAKEAVNTNLTLAQAAKVTTLTLDVAAKVIGTGTIGTANINVSGTTMEQKPTTVNVPTGVQATVAGNTAASTPAPVSTPAPSTGGGGGGTSTPYVDLSIKENMSTIEIYVYENERLSEILNVAADASITYSKSNDNIDLEDGIYGKQIKGIVPNSTTQVTVTASQSGYRSKTVSFTVKVLTIAAVYNEETLIEAIKNDAITGILLAPRTYNVEGELPNPSVQKSISCSDSETATVNIIGKKPQNLIVGNGVTLIEKSEEATKLQAPANAIRTDEELRGRWDAVNNSSGYIVRLYKESKTSENLLKEIEISVDEYETRMASAGIGLFRMVATSVIDSDNYIFTVAAKGTGNYVDSDEVYIGAPIVIAAASDAASLDSALSANETATVLVVKNDIEYKINDEFKNFVKPERIKMIVGHNEDYNSYEPSVCITAKSFTSADNKDFPWFSIRFESVVNNVEELNNAFKGFGGSISMIVPGKEHYATIYPPDFGFVDEAGNVAVDVWDVDALRIAVGYDSEIDFVNVKDDIYDITETIVVSNDAAINGEGHMLAFGDNEEDWQENYVIQVYDATGVTISDLKLTGGDAGLLVKGSTVTLTGTIDVSGNEFGGIEVSMGNGVTAEPKLTVNATLVNGTEAYGLPTIWENGVKGTVVGANVPTTTNETLKADQVQYYMIEGNATAGIDKAALDSATATMNTKVYTDYTAASWATLEAAKTAIGKMPESTQTEVNVKTDAVNAAVAALVENDKVAATVSEVNLTVTQEYGLALNFRIDEAINFDERANIKISYFTKNGDTLTPISNTLAGDAPLVKDKAWGGYLWSGTEASPVKYSKGSDSPTLSNQIPEGIDLYTLVKKGFAADGSMNYTAITDWTQPATYVVEIRVTDNDGNVSELETVEVTVEPVPPVNEPAAINNAKLSIDGKALLVTFAISEEIDFGTQANVELSYFVKDGETFVPIKTTGEGSTDLIKSKAWAGYLASTEVPGENYSKGSETNNYLNVIPANRNIGSKVQNGYHAPATDMDYVAISDFSAAPGTYKVNIKVTDNGGKVSEKEVTVTVEPVPPVNEPAAINNAKLSIDGKALLVTFAISEEIDFGTQANVELSYFVKDGETFVPIKTTGEGSTDLVKSKAWAGYLASTEVPGENYSKGSETNNYLNVIPANRNIGSKVQNGYHAPATDMDYVAISDFSAAPGTYKVNIIVTDNGGKVSEKEVTVTVEPVPPVNEPAAINNAKLSIDGKALLVTFAISEEIDFSTQANVELSYFVKDGETFVPIKTTGEGSTDLVKSKAWAGYLASTEVPGENYSKGSETNNYLNVIPANRNIGSKVQNGYHAPATDMDYVAISDFSAAPGTYMVNIKVTDNAGKVSEKEVTVIVEPVPGIDKAALESATATMNTKVYTDYTAASWATLEAAKTAIGKMPESTQTEVNVKTDAVNAAVAALVENDKVAATVSEVNLTVTQEYGLALNFRIDEAINFDERANIKISYFTKNGDTLTPISNTLAGDAPLVKDKAWGGYLWSGTEASPVKYSKGSDSPTLSNQIPEGIDLYTLVKKGFAADGSMNYTAITDWTQPATYVVEIRVTDNDGNVSELETVEVTVEAAK